MPFMEVHRYSGLQNILIHLLALLCMTLFVISNWSPLAFMAFHL
jgi:hypothetical protein